MRGEKRRKVFKKDTDSPGEEKTAISRCQRPGTENPHCRPPSDTKTLTSRNRSGGIRKRKCSPSVNDREDTEKSLPILAHCGSVRTNSAQIQRRKGVQNEEVSVSRSGFFRCFPKDSVSAQNWQFPRFCMLFLTFWEPSSQASEAVTVRVRNNTQIYILLD